MNERTSSGPELLKSVKETFNEINQTTRYGMAVMKWLEKNQSSEPTNKGSIEESLDVLSMLLSSLGDAAQGVPEIGRLRDIGELVVGLKETLIQHGIIFRPPQMFTDVNSDCTELTINGKWIEWYSSKWPKTIAPEDKISMVTKALVIEVTDKIIPKGLETEYDVSVMLNTKMTNGVVTITRKPAPALRDGASRYFGDITSAK